ncbi:MAG: STT3 domain-containing protein [Candidatus Woesearchaeota archaeon]
MSKKKHARSSEMKQIIDFMQRQYVIVPLLLIILVAVTFYVRMGPASLDITDDWALQTIESQYKQQIEMQIRQQFPNLPAQSIQSRVNLEWQEFYRENQLSIHQQVQDASAYFRSQLQDEYGKTYLTGIDPYYFLRFTENYINNGHTGEYLNEEGVPSTRFNLAPSERRANTDTINYMQAYVYRFVSLFNKDVQPMHTAFYTQIIVMAAIAVLLFFVLRLFIGNTGAFLGTLLLVIHRVALQRTMGGFADTDGFVLFYALLITIAFVFAISQNNVWKRNIGLAIAGLFVGFFALAWQGWWYIFFFIIGAWVGYMLYILISDLYHTKRLTFLAFKNSLLSIGVFVLSGVIFVSLFTSFNRVLRALPRLFQIREIRQATVGEALWPNVLRTVAELNPGNIPTIISQAGGVMLLTLVSLGFLLFICKQKTKLVWMLFSASFIYYIFLFYQATQGSISNIYMLLFLYMLPLLTATGIKIYQKEQADYQLLFVGVAVVWFVGSFYASMYGIRFVLMMAPPIAIGFGLCVGILILTLQKRISSWLAVPHYVPVIGLTILVLLFMLPHFSYAQTVSNNSIPIVNDAWVETLTAIKDNSQQDAIISSWWDFGHFFSYFAQRGTTSDGASQNQPQSHWLGRLLLESNETKSVGILRMLNCGANSAFDVIDEQMNDTEYSISVLNDILGVSRQDAVIALQQQGFSQVVIDDILASTHCQPPESFLITSGDMVGKSGVWAHFGGWDFARAKIRHNLPNRTEALALIQDRLAVDEVEAVQVYNQLRSFTTDQMNAWISPWPSYMTQQGSCQQQQGLVVCSNGIVINQSQAFINTGQGIIDLPLLVDYTNGSMQIFLSEVEDANLAQEAAVVLWNQNGQMRSVVAHPALAQSVFHRLFYGEGVASEYYTLFYDVTQFTGERILTWQVDWDAYLAEYE